MLANQLRYILDQCTRSNVDVRVVPFRVGWQPLVDGAFTVMDGSVVHMETRKSGVFLHESDDVRIYLDAIERIREVSCDPAESRQMLAVRLKELEKMK